jgi:hypothetical protein
LPSAVKNGQYMAAAVKNGQNLFSTVFLFEKFCRNVPHRKSASGPPDCYAVPCCAVCKSLEIKSEVESNEILFSASDVWGSEWIAPTRTRTRRHPTNRPEYDPTDPTSHQKRTAKIIFHRNERETIYNDTEILGTKRHDRTIECL